MRALGQQTREAETEGLAWAQCSGPPGPGLVRLEPVEGQKAGRERVSGEKPAPSAQRPARGTWEDLRPKEQGAHGTQGS